MLDPLEFDDFPLNQKIDLLYQQGDFVVAIRYYGYKVNLYLLHGFYVEVFYNHKWDRIERISLLDPRHSRIKFYEDQIKLPANLF